MAQSRNLAVRKIQVCSRMVWKRNLAVRKIQVGSY